MQTSRTALLFFAALVLYATFGFATAWAHAAQAGAAAKGDVEEVEVADVSEVKPADAAARPLLDTISRFHPPLVHLPIAWLMLLVLVDGATFLGGKPWEKAGFYLLWLAAVSCVPAVTTGLLREDCYKGGAEVKTIITTHKWLALTTASLCIVALGIRLLSRNDLKKTSKFAYLAVVFAAGLLIGAVGHKGGQIVFGKGYLPF